VEELLCLKDIEVKRSGRRILEIPELVLREGEVMGVIGPNGAGKTTLLLVLGGLEKPSRGEIFYQGRRIGTERERLNFRRRLSVVFQEPLLFDGTVYDNVAMGLRFRRLPEREVRRRVEDWLGRLGIEHLASRRARSLSGGEAQRVCLARALTLKPELLLLDEPFASLDPPSRSALLDELGTILGGTGITAVFVTHDFRELPYLAHRVAAIWEGHILQVGPTDEVLRRPTSLALADFLGVTNRLRAKVGGGQDGMSCLIGPGNLQLWYPRDGLFFALAEEVVALWRPEEAYLLRFAPPGARNVWPAVVRKVTAGGGQGKVVVECGGLAFTVVAPLAPGGLAPWAAGDRVYLVVPPEAVHVLPANR
jgi:tungstate transport system ATP-binding protein